MPEITCTDVCDKLIRRLKLVGYQIDPGKASHEQAVAALEDCIIVMKANDRDTTQRREGKMQPWELSDEELGKLCYTPEILRSIATAAGQKARAVTAWEIYDWLAAQGEICHLNGASVLARWLTAERIKRPEEGK